MRRAAIVLAVAASLVAIPAGPSWACSCATPTPREQARRADVVFAGAAVSVTRASNLVGMDKARFSVEIAYKGPVEPWITVATPSDEAACGFAFREGGRYTVFASVERGRLATSICTPTTFGDIDPGRFGLIPRQISRPTGVDPEAGWALAIVAGVLAVVGATAAVALRRRAT